MYVALQRN